MVKDNTYKNWFNSHINEIIITIALLLSLYILYIAITINGSLLLKNVLILGSICYILMAYYTYRRR
jgi:hypothetical protein